MLQMASWYLERSGWSQSTILQDPYFSIKPGWNLAFERTVSAFKVIHNDGIMKGIFGAVVQPTVGL